MPTIDQSSGTIPMLPPLDYRAAALWSRPAGLGLAWSSTTITYSFPTAGSVFGNPYVVAGDETDTAPEFQPFNAAQREAARAALKAWSDVIDIRFQEVPDTASGVGDIRFAFTTMQDPYVAAYAYYPSSAYPAAGDVWVSDAYINSAMKPGSFSFLALIHELGHALGLSHPFGQDSARSTPALPSDEDNVSRTLMSYTPYKDSQAAATPMPYDILAAQWIYGANKSYNAGDTVYRFDVNKPYFQTIWDGGGNDTLSANAPEFYTGYRGAIIDLRSGEMSSIGTLNQGYSEESWYSQNITIAYNCVIENAEGTLSSDLLIGNEANNRLIGHGGGAGTDALDGHGGADTVVLDGPRADYGLIVGGIDAARYLPAKDVSPRPDGNTPDLLIAPLRANLTTYDAAKFGGTVTRNVERVEFTDAKIAFDMDGNAGKVAKAITLLWGRETLANRDYVGVGLKLLDGGWSYEQLMAAAIDLVVGPNASNAQVASRLAGSGSVYESLLNNGQISKGSLGVLIAEGAGNLQRVDLVGLQASGLEYL